MFDLAHPVFGFKQPDIIFVQDFLLSEVVGGAELSTDALQKTSPVPFVVIKSQDLRHDQLEKYKDKHWIFGNFAGIHPQVINYAITNLKYSILEYDYKFCQLRSPEKHLFLTGKVCDCSEQKIGKLVSSFYYGASSLWWMSEKQKEKYLTYFPFLSKKENTVLSSIFSRKTLELIQSLRNKASESSTQRKGWIVLKSDSWVKGFDVAVKWCKDNGKDYEIVCGLPYEEMLTKLSQSEGLVYLPTGGDTCPRLVIEAKLLGCKLELNDNVEHAKEPWFNTDDVEKISNYLFSCTDVFWTAIKKHGSFSSISIESKK
jgi:hypothetical protein